MKRWLKLAAWSLGLLGVLTALAVGVFVALDQLHRRRAITQIRSISRDRIERIATESKYLVSSQTSGWRVASVASTPFADLGAEYVVLDQHRVDLVFYKLFEDEVALYVYFDPARIEMVFPTDKGLRAEKIWQEETAQVAASAKSNK